MDIIKLTPPLPKHREAAMELKDEFFDNGESVINGSALLDQMEYDAWLLNTRRNGSPHTVREDWVMASTFFAVRENDCRLIGTIDVRHHIQNDFLSKYGGHIGYSVRPSERRKGYGAKMLGLALSFAGRIGLKRIMLGCYSDNIASIKTIQKHGGFLCEKKPYIDGKSVDIYWITLE